MNYVKGGIYKEMQNHEKYFREVATDCMEIHSTQKDYIFETLFNLSFVLCHECYIYIYTIMLEFKV